ncbi:hypothetical protein [Rugamonas apoptosis]|uniref:Uncharacterized protein n=1 Tax=Rugamonas apoptosis TaxID=2758570 RepID=A0A7W2IJM8_9BURK|nr:hypothetical protein [Rugamonas apoptosis]MBA5686689.1 hypothetical protein [Rugamonas apoptosis]
MRIKRVLESENGFLACEVLSDPSTVEYMKLEVADLRKKLRASEHSRTTAEERVTELSRVVGTLEEEAWALARQASVANEAAIGNAGRADVASKEVGQLKKRLAVQDDELQELRTRLNDWLVDGRWNACFCLGRLGSSIPLALDINLTTRRGSAALSANGTVGALAVGANMGCQIRSKFECRCSAPVKATLCFNGS